MGPVLWGVTPIPTEGLMSLVTRTVTRNILPSSHVLLSQVGAAHANNPTAALLPDLDEEGLAQILRQPLAEVNARRHLPRTDAGYVDFFGNAVRADEIVFRRRRFGPTAVACSPHARALWSLKTVPCCTEHWEYLVDVCTCGERQRWQSAERLDRCDCCNAPLAQVQVETVDPSLRDGLEFVIGLIDPDEDRLNAARAQLPPELSELDGGLVFELALAVMPLTPGGFRLERGAEPKAVDLPRYAQSLAEAADIVRQWPEGFMVALGRALRERSTSKRNVRYKGAAYYLPALDSEMLPSVVRATIASVMSPITSTSDGLPEGQIGMREAALLTGQEERNLANARRLGHLAMRICVRANRIIPTLDRGEIELIDDLLHNRIGPEKFTHSLHLPQYAMAQLVDENLVTCVTHPYVVAHLGPLQVHESELKKFRDALTRGATSADDIDNPVPLHRAARAIGGGAKPWGSILRDMLERNIPFSITGGSTNRIMIASGDAAKLRAKYANLSDGVRTRFVSQRDAAEILNLPLKHSHVIHVSARRGKSAHQISWARVRKLARDRITLAELSARSGIHPTRLEGMLERDGCRRHDALGWMRRKALTKIAQYGVGGRGGGKRGSAGLRR
ncbi:TniQ family protein [Sphingomonas sp. BK069]|uniref:TniQ family protein n=1 Tax=Sphingomonas sp. BK069 TaxID=2586979 RepID=UPI00161576F7|nr:TniQ family protein [Sphingomonas sp. BK069]MBB3349283.1 hypothetical protein [Sphingomonas sp. BK069]